MSHFWLVLHCLLAAPGLPALACAFYGIVPGGALPQVTRALQNLGQEARSEEILGPLPAAAVALHDAGAYIGAMGQRSKLAGGAGPLRLDDSIAAAFGHRVLLTWRIDVHSVRQCICSAARPGAY